MGSGMVGLSDVGLGLTLVLHVSNESVLVISVVGDDLDPAVGKLSPILSLYDSVLVLGLGLGEVAAVLVSAAVLVREGLRGLLLLVVGRRVVRGRGRSIGSRGVGSRGVGGGQLSSGGEAHQSQRNNYLHV